MRFFGHHGAHPFPTPDQDGEIDRRHARGFFGRGEFGGFGHHHRGGGPGRLFAHGDMRHIVLYLIAEKPRHGYEIIKAIEEMTDGAYTPSPGTIYPTLTLLEEEGLVTVEAGESGKKLYTITALGTERLEPHRPVIEAVIQRHRGEAGRRGGPSPRVVRAIQGLRLALELKREAGPLTDDRVDAIVEALDEATRKIERA